MISTQPMNEADKKWGYRFGCDGLVSLQNARDAIGGVSHNTLQRRVDAGFIRKGKHPDGNLAVICRRSLSEYIARMEV